MKRIPLWNKDIKFLGYALVDDDVYKWAKQYRWRVSNLGYVVRYVRKGAVSFLHNDIIQCSVPDHINRDKFDNTRKNLRMVNGSVNNLNKKIQSNNKSGYKGVCLAPNGKYKAQANQNKQRVFLGNYDTAEEASLAYVRFVQKHHKYDPLTNKLL